MKKIICIAFLLFSVHLKAQEYPYYYFSHLNQVVYNPSLVSADNKMSADVFTYQMTAGGFNPISDYSASFSFSPGFNKKSRSNYYQAHYGIGINVLRDIVGPFNHNILQLIYAYHLPVADGIMTSFGINLLTESFSVNTNSLNPLQKEDPRLLSGNNRSMFFDGGFGVSLTGEKFRMSLSAQNLAPGTFIFSESAATEFKVYRKFFLTCFYKFELQKEIAIKPHIVLRNNLYKKAAFDSFVEYNSRLFSFGGGYRSEQSIFLFASFPVSDFVISYTSENPVISNHLTGNGHIFSIGWKMK